MPAFRSLVRFLAVLTLAGAGRAAGGETNLDDFSSLSAWTVAPGTGCKGTITESLAAGTGYSGQGALLTYDFTAVTKTPNFYTGCWVQMTRDLSLSTVPAALAFWVLSPPDAMLNLAVEDSTGQWLTYHLSRPFYALDPTQWYQQVVELDAPSSWAGGNGAIQAPIQAVAIEVQNRASWRTSGTVSIDELGSFDAIGGPLEPFGSPLYPPPDGGAFAGGFSVNIYQNSTVIPDVADAGFDFTRTDVHWSTTEPDAGVYDFTLEDQVAAALAPFGMHALFLVGGGNPVYGDCGPDAGCSGGCAPSSQKSITHFQTFAKKLAAHFAGQGHRYEIWNEPESTQYCWPTSATVDYPPVLQAGIAGVHAGDPSALVTTGGLASPGGGDALWPATFAWSFLASMLEADGGVAGADAVAFHPYRPGGAETITDDLVLARSLIAPYLGAPSIWNTEWGYDVADDADAGVQGAAAWQALDDVRILLATGAAGMGLSNVFSSDYPGFTILEPDGGFAPAASAIAVLASQLAGRSFAGFVPAIPTSLHALRFDGSRDALLVLWSDAPGGSTSVEVPAPTAAVGETGNALTLPQDGGLATVTVQESAGPIYLTEPWPVDGGVDGGPADAGSLEAGSDAGGAGDGGFDAGSHRDAGEDAGTGADAGRDGGEAVDAGVGPTDDGGDGGAITRDGGTDGGAADAGAGPKDGGTDGGAIAANAGSDAGAGDAGRGSTEAPDGGTHVAPGDGGAAIGGAAGGCGCSPGAGQLDVMSVLLALAALRRRRL
ncbi:MAG TPA: hypothetical protein VMB50_19875 [Myxococcales bacterium]|nr:hypothetical protein [Myxococcales bacterium]